MKFLSIATALSAACSAVLAHPVDHEDHSILHERQSGIVVTTGATGNIYPRTEVRTLKDTKPNQWILFILALSQWQTQSQGSATSYFGISSIHGVPRVNYNGVGQCSSCGGSDGYCTHDSILFPAWHRAYVALFEQEFIKVAKSIANSFPASRRQAMVDASNQIRFPYWDWAKVPPNNLPALPLMISDEKVTINGPNGQQTIQNPMQRYTYTDSSGMFYSPFTTYPRTLRYPNSNNRDAYTRTSQSAAAFANIRRSLQDQVYSLLTQCTNYVDFASDDASTSSPGCSNSLEGIHNSVHTAAGGPGSNGVSGGHMTYLPLASFDPIFWLHHANVDRLFAFWQTINPNSYGGSQNAPHNTWTIAQGSRQNADSNLTPFYRDTNRNFWTTNRVRDWANTFRYTYPEFSTTDGSRASIINAVNRLYGPNAGAVPNSKRDAFPEAQATDLVGGLVQGVSNLAKDILSGDPLRALNGSAYEYAVNIQSPRYALNGSYQIFCFNGKPTTEDPSSWIFDPKLIGPMGVMSMPGMTDSKVIAAGSVPLTRTLQSMVGTQGGLLANLATPLVVAFLTKNLEWRVQGPDGTAIDPGTIDGFVVEVVSTTKEVPASDSELPTYSGFVSLLDVTKGQSGGANETLHDPTAYRL